MLDRLFRICGFVGLSPTLIAWLLLIVSVIGMVASNVSLPNLLGYVNKSDMELIVSKQQSEITQLTAAVNQLKAAQKAVEIAQTVAQATVVETTQARAVVNKRVTTNVTKYENRIAEIAAQPEVDYTVVEQQTATAEITLLWDNHCVISSCEPEQTL